MQSGSLTRYIPSVGTLVGLLLLLCQLKLATIKQLGNDQTGLASGSLPTWACQGIACGVQGTAVPTPPLVALQGPWRPFPTVNDWHVSVMLTWPWWSLEGLLAGARRIGPTPKKEVLVFVITPKQGRWSLNSKCRRPTALPKLWGLGCSSTKRRSNMGF